MTARAYIAAATDMGRASTYPAAALARRPLP